MKLSLVVKSCLGTACAAALIAGCSTPGSPAQDKKLLDYIADSRKATKPIVPATCMSHPKLTVKRAYELQEQFYTRLTDYLGEPIGYKLAYASKAAQEANNIPEPVYGRLFAQQRVESGGKVALSNYNKLRIEAEVVLVMARGISKQIKDVDELKACVKSIHIGFDINDARFDTSRGKPKPPDVIVSGVGVQNFVVGPAHDPASVNIDDIPLVMTQNGKQVYAGRTSAVMGSPWTAALWLAQRLIADGKEIKAGDVILTGSVAKAYGGGADTLPGTYVGSTDALGSVTVEVD